MAKMTNVAFAIPHSFADYGALLASVLLTGIVALMPAQFSKADDKPEAEMPKPVLVLDDVLERMGKRQMFDAPGDVFPSAPFMGAQDDGKFSSPDGQTGHAGFALSDPLKLAYQYEWTPPHPKRYHYDLVKVEPGESKNWLTKLRTVEHTRLYGFYSVETRLERLRKVGAREHAGFKPFFENRCRYVRVIDLSGGKYVENSSGIEEFPSRFDFGDERDRTTIYFASPWYPALKGSQLKRIWVEFTIRVDSTGLPIDLPDGDGRAVAVETENDLFLVRERVDDQTAFPGYFVHFTGKTWEIQGNVSRQAVEKVVTEYLKELGSAFGADPIAASVVNNEPLPPGEILFRRNRDSSRVLKGFAGPYFELSTYIVRWWSYDKESVWPPDAAAAKGGEYYFGKYIFVQVNHSLTVAVGKNGIYAEPKDDQVDPYRKATDAALQRALARACNTLGGKVVGGVGIVQEK